MEDQVSGSDTSERNERLRTRVKRKHSDSSTAESTSLDGYVKYDPLCESEEIRIVVDSDNSEGDRTPQNLQIPQLHHIPQSHQILHSHHIAPTVESSLTNETGGKSNSPLQSSLIAPQVEPMPQSDRSDVQNKSVFNIFISNHMIRYDFCNSISDKLIIR